MTQEKTMENGFGYVEITNEAASAKVALQGAHVFHYARKGEDPILWLSDTNICEYGRAIRGGVPICWPSFGMNNLELPQHGFARTFLWEFLEAKEIDARTSHVVFSLKESEDSRKIWNNAFDLELKVTISDTLSIALRTRNTDTKSFKITQALHTYFAVSHIDAIAIEGLENKPYLDALTGTISQQKGCVIFNKEIDRVYQEVDAKIVLKDKERDIEIENKGSLSSVLWNPWIEKSKRMSAMRDDAYIEFVCIESANAYADFKTLEPGQSHTLEVCIT